MAILQTIQSFALFLLSPLALGVFFVTYLCVCVDLPLPLPSPPFMFIHLLTQLFSSVLSMCPSLLHLSLQSFSPVHSVPNRFLSSGQGFLPSSDKFHILLNVCILVCSSLLYHLPLVPMFHHHITLHSSHRLSKIFLLLDEKVLL